MTTDQPGDEILGLYREGVHALSHHGHVVDWQAPACGAWTGAELAHHVAAVADWYHQWLDRAIAGHADPPFPSAELPRRNDEAIHARSPMDPAESMAQFVTSAERYGDRLADHWDVPYGFPFGTVTAGMHAAAAASEWHIHAWDLARAGGGDHRPSDPRALFRAVGRCVSTARGGLAGAGQAAVVRLVAPIRPWDQLLRASGRRARR